MREYRYQIASGALSSIAMGMALAPPPRAFRFEPVKRVAVRPPRGDARDPKRKKTTRAFRKWQRKHVGGVRV